jgi:hypothetical protein
MRCCIGPVIPSAWVNRIAWYGVSLNHTPSLIDAPGRATKRMAEEQKRTITLVWSRADTSKECRTGMLGKGTTCSVDVRCRYCDLRALMDASNDRHNLSKLLTHPGVNVGPPRCFPFRLPRPPRGTVPWGGSGGFWGASGQAMPWPATILLKAHWHELFAPCPFTGSPWPGSVK